MKQPNLETILDKLNDILVGNLSREDVTEWAMKFIEDDDLHIEDFEAWEFLKQVGGVDMIESPDSYLYTEDDIRLWISEKKEKLTS